MNNTETGGSAFPSHGSMGDVVCEGMTLRQYAAIKLKVPDSGTDWLDAMIKKSLKDDFALAAMPVWVQAHIDQSVDDLTKGDIAGECYSYADYMQKARK